MRTDSAITDRNPPGWAMRRPVVMRPDLVVDPRATKDIANDYRPGTWGKEQIRMSDSRVKQWEKEAVMRVRNAREHTAASPVTKRLSYVLGSEPEPEGQFPVSGLADIEDWDALRSSSAWKQLVETD